MRNSKQTLALAKLDANQGVRGLYSDGINTVNTNSVLKISDQLIEGVEGKEFLVNNWDDEKEFARVMKEACDEVASVINLSEASGRVAAGLFQRYTPSDH